MGGSFLTKMNWKVLTERNLSEYLVRRKMLRMHEARQCLMRMNWKVLNVHLQIPEQNAKLRRMENLGLCLKKTNLRQQVKRAMWMWMRRSWRMQWLVMRERKKLAQVQVRRLRVIWIGRRLTAVM